MRKMRANDTAQPLMSKIRTGRKFKKMEKKSLLIEDEQRPKFNLICIGNVKDSRTRLVVSEKSQQDQQWSTTTLKLAPPDVQKKAENVAKSQPKHKRMLAFSSKHFTFECAHQIKCNLVTFDDTVVGEQDVSQMATHQIRFDDGIFFFFSFIITLLNHGSQFDAHQFLNILFPVSQNPEQEEGRICILQPSVKYLPFALDLLKFLYAMTRRINNMMRDCENETIHMDMCQGMALFEALRTINATTIKGKSDIYKMIFDKKNGAIGGIYDDMKRFDDLYPDATLIFKKGLSQLRKHPDAPPQKSF